MNISPLELGKGHLAHTLIEQDGKSYEVLTLNTTESLDETVEKFWHELLKEYPYETTVYRAIPANTPYTQLEQSFAELVPINSSLRRDLQLGDLYISRSVDADSAALEHDNIVEMFKSGEMLLLTQEERAAIYGPSKLFQ